MCLIVGFERADAGYHVHDVSLLMALIFLGHSKCALCDKILMEGDEIVGLPAATNPEHPLWRYFDAGYHAVCFENWDKKEEVNGIIEEERRMFESSDYYKEMSAKHGKPKG